MGWKAVKEHYRISHIVQVRKDGGICIGSSLVHDIIIIHSDGRVRIDRGITRGNESLTRYVKEFEADPAKLKELLTAPDTFGPSNVVYTYDGGTIIEKQCEVLGWPNLTHDGEIMYDNTHSTDRAEVVEWARKNAMAGVKMLKERVRNDRLRLAEAKRCLAEEEANFAALTTE